MDRIDFADCSVLVIEDYRLVLQGSLRWLALVVVGKEKLKV